MRRCAVKKLLTYSMYCYYQMACSLALFACSISAMNIAGFCLITNKAMDWCVTEH